jgi:hypothetical protein
MSIANIYFIRVWKESNKLSLKNAHMLLEAYRRYHMFHKDEPLNKAWVGLGYVPHYKSKYFYPIHDMSPRVQQWWGLTDEGVRVVEDLISKLKWKEEYSLDILKGVSI